MTNCSEQLLELQVQIAEKEHIETKLQNLRTQKESLEYNISKLGQEKVREDEDVEKLEGGSLLGLLLHLTGSYDKKLSKEQQEAIDAGKRAKGIADQIGEHLSKAGSWGTFDIWAADSSVTLQSMTTSTRRKTLSKHCKSSFAASTQSLPTSTNALTLLR